MLSVPYSKPHQLSDPFFDFMGCDLDRILQTPEAELGWGELSWIFNSYLPAGNYPECAYYLPYALEFIQTEEGYELIANVLIWLSEYQDDLRRDGLLEPVLDVLETMCVDWLSQFELKSYSNWRIAPKWIFHVSDLFSGLHEIEKLAPFRTRFTRHFCSPPMTYEKAGWFCAIADKFYFFQSLQKSAVLTEFVKNEQHRQQAYSLLLEHALSDALLLDYCDRMFRELGLF